MTEDLDFNLENFWKEVSAQYSLIKGWEFFKEFPPRDVKNEPGNRLAGCLVTPFTFFVDKFAKKSLEKELKKRNYKGFKKEAEDLLAEKDIKEAIRSSLRKEKEILTEDKFIETVTKTLAEKELRKQFVIPLEAMLFACVAFQISQTGIENFCNEI